MRNTRPALKIATMAALCFAMLAFTFLGLTGTPLGAQVPHNDTVPEMPRRNTPVVLDGTVFAHAQVGNRIFVGGNFQRVQRPNGTIIDQAYIFAYDIDTGLIDENFRPVLNNSVQALETGAGGNGLFASGRFTRWDSSFPTRIAKLSANGTLDTNFTGSANAIVRDIAVTSKAVYLAGDFTQVSGQPRVGFAAVRLGTGAADPGFVMNVQNSQAVGGEQLARGIVADPSGNFVYGLHFGTQINGFNREAVVKVNVAGPTAGVANWTIPWTAQAGEETCIEFLRDIAISPDGSFIVIGTQGRDIGPNCDSILRYETSPAGVQQFTWTARMYSSVFSLAVSDVAVYAGGHFCAAPRVGAPVSGSTHPWNPNESAANGRANGCTLGELDYPTNPSHLFPHNAVFRKQIAALNPTNGQALAWNPGSNASLGVMDLTVIDRGLLVGQDNNRLGDNINTGRSGFFDFNDTEGPTLTHASPRQRVEGTRLLFGGVSDESGVDRVEVLIQNNQTGQVWNGSSWQSARTRVRANIAGTAWNVQGINFDRAGTYSVFHWAYDLHGNQTGWAENPRATLTITSNDRVGPTLTHSSPLTRGLGERLIFGNVTDASAVEGVEVLIQEQKTGLIWDGLRWQTERVRLDANINANAWNVQNIDFRRNGTYTVVHWATDVHGNQSGWSKNPIVNLEIG